MKNKRYIFFIALLLSLLASCASQFTFIAPQSCAEASALKNICRNPQYDGTDRNVADSLYNQGAVLIRTGNYEKAYTLLNQSIVRYELIIIRQANRRKEQDIDFQKRELAKDLDELSQCQKIINELSPAEQP